jgi:4-hydroxybenzoate polyprenyltransferase
MKLVRALIAASHPAPCVAVTAIATLLAAEAAPPGFGAGRLALVALAVLAGQLSVGWSNDAIDADRDTAAGRTDKPAAIGLVSARTLWLGAAIGVLATLALAAALGPVSLAIDAAMTAVAWAYNLGLKSTVWSGACYAIAFGLLLSFAASALPGAPLATWSVTLAAALLGLGAHFANVLPDLAADERNGVRGLPQRVAARFGPGATRAAALVLLLGATVLLLVAASPGRRWVAVAGLCGAAVLALAGAVGRGRLPFLAAIGIAGVDAALVAAGVEALTAGPHVAGALG